MKKVFMMIAMMAVTFAAQAQTKFHDVEANDATGAVKSITTNVMGQGQTINFSQDGKMSGDGISNAKYDADGYLQSVTIKRSMMGQEMEQTRTIEYYE